MVGLGTLLAGAIGVSNIMMVTVKERTTEIGIRRAIGARPNDILSQILSESMVLTILAGMAGISFAVFLLNLTEMGTSTPTSPTEFQISFWQAIGACALLLILGLLAGLAPHRFTNGVGKESLMIKESSVLALQYGHAHQLRHTVKRKEMIPSGNGRKLVCFGVLS